MTHLGKPAMGGSCPRYPAMPSTVAHSRMAPPRSALPPSEAPDDGESPLGAYLVVLRATVWVARRWPRRVRPSRLVEGRDIEAQVERSGVIPRARVAFNVPGKAAGVSEAHLLLHYSVECA